MTIERNSNGDWVVTDIVRGHLARRTYSGCSKLEAAKRFRRDIRRKRTVASIGVTDAVVRQALKDAGLI